MSETGNFNIVPEGLYFNEDGTEPATPGRFNTIFDAINLNVDKQMSPAPICDSFTDIVVYTTDGEVASAIPSSVTLADVTAWPESIEGKVNISFELESGNIGQLGSPTGSGAGAQVDWDLGSYVGSLGTDKTEVVTVKMTATWDSKTKYAYATFNLVAPAAKGNPGIDRLIPRIHVADTEMSLDGPVSGDAEFIVSDASLILYDDTTSRAWKLFHSDDLGTELLSSAPNIYVGTITGTVGDADFLGGENGSATLRVPVKLAGQYVLELHEKGVLDASTGDPITTNVAVNDTVNLLVRPYAARSLTFNDGYEPRQPIHISIAQGIAGSSIVDSTYDNNKAFTYDSQIHYVEVVWGYKSSEPDTDQAKIVKLSEAGRSALNLVEGEYYLVSINTGSLRAEDYWNTLRLWLEGQSTSGYEIIDTLSSSERTTIDGLYTGFNRDSFDTVVIKTHSNAIISGDDFTSVLTHSIWQIGPGAEKYKIELAVLSPSDNTIQSVWARTQLLSLDASRPAPISYRFTGVPRGFKVVARVTSINGSVATNPQITSSLVVGYDASWVLSAPANLNFSSRTFGVTLTWDAVTDAAGYEVAYSTSPNPTFSGSNEVVRTTAPITSIPAETGATVYVAVRAINASGVAGSSATSSGSASTVQIGRSDKYQVIGSRSVGSGDITRDSRTLTIHGVPAPVRVKSMGVYVHELTLRGSNTNELITFYNGDDTKFYSVPASGEGYYVDEDFPLITLGQGERVRIAAWDPDGRNDQNDIEVSVDYTYNELASD